MHGEPTPSRPDSSESRRTTFDDILRRDENEPSATGVILRAINMAELRMNEAEQRAAVAEAELLLAEEELSIDSDTGLWTEKKFSQEIYSWVTRKGADPNTQIALIFVDMNNLKDINDKQGHAAGDQAIRDMAVTIRDIADADLRADDFRAVSRSNKQGDEFMLALPAREATDLRQNDLGDAIDEALSKKISKLIQAGRENNRYALGYVFTTRGEILENGLDFYRDMADAQMYKNKQRMKARVLHENDERQARTGTHHI
ncbi:MAG: GGDEF domain-containing protein [Candidatus Saccharimonadaceae bacterium]